MAIKSSASVNERGVGSWNSENFGQELKRSYKKNVNLVRNLEKGLKRSHGVAFSVLTSDVNKEIVVSKTPMFDPSMADPKTIASVILGGGTEVPIGGCYRLIDIPMSTCINSGINKIFVMARFNSASLNRHLARTYNFGNGINFGNGFVEVLASTQTPGELGMHWFQGTADAVRQFTWVFEDTKNKNIEHILILSGDHLYRMDYSDFVRIDKTGRIIQFSEKPKRPELEAMKVDTTILGLSHQGGVKAPYIASMGVYVFKRDVLPRLSTQSSHMGASCVNGCFLRECSVEHSIVGVRSRLEFGVELKDTMMMGADYYQTEAEIASLLADGKVPIGLGENTNIRNCIIDKNARIGKHVGIANKDGVQEADRPQEGFYIRSGITVVL